MKANQLASIGILYLVCLAMTTLGTSCGGGSLPSTGSNSPSSEPHKPTIGAQARKIEATILRGDLVIEAELAGLSTEELRILRNTIFAQHGKQYDRPGLGEYFDTCAWYKPNPAYTDATANKWLTENDKTNVKTFLRWEEIVKAKPGQPSLPESSQRERPSPAAEEESVLEGVKTITELTAEELDVANGICQKALKDYFGKSVIAWYQTTYHYLPISDEDLVSAEGKKLQVPITLVSASVPTAYDFPEIKRRLKEEVASLEASHGGRRYRIYKSVVNVNPGGGGGSMGMSYDMVTLIPYSVIIY
jgi:YARHG domain-containing protein